MENLNKVIHEHDFFHCVERQGYIFTSITAPANVYDAIVIRNPENCDASTPKKTFSKLPLEDHIKLINQYKLEKAIIIAEDIEFIERCPFLKYLVVVPANTACEEFDFSPLYNMPEIVFLECRTEYGKHEELHSRVDYTRINGLIEISLSGMGHQNYNRISTLEKLSISYLKIRDFTDFGACKKLKKLDIVKIGLKSLQGIENFQDLQQLNLCYERGVYDISELKNVAGTLRSLSIENCPKIEDFSILEQLIYLEHLELLGNNKLPDLKFLKRMKNLKTFTFSMEIQDGDLTPCLEVPYVCSAQNRKGYNLKDKDLPKRIPTEGFRLR